MAIHILTAPFAGGGVLGKRLLGDDLTVNSRGGPITFDQVIGKSVQLDSTPQQVVNSLTQEPVHMTSQDQQSGIAVKAIYTKALAIAAGKFA